MFSADEGRERHGRMPERADALCDVCLEWYNTENDQEASQHDH